MAQSRLLKIFAIIFFSIGGGDLGFLKATELNTICTNQSCTLTRDYADITNHANLSRTLDLSNHTITNLTNYATMGGIGWGSGNITNLTNYGTMGGITGVRMNNPTPTAMTITNYGTMGGISTEYGNKDITIANYGVINVVSNNQHLRDAQNYFYVIKDWAMIIDESQSTFNGTTTATGNNSHIFTNVGHRLRFADSGSKIILDFGDNFELGKAYSLDKIIIGSNWTNTLKVDFDRLTTRSSLYQLKQSGNNFIVTIDTANSEISTLYKSNIRTMNNFDLISNALIYPHKYKGTNRSTRKRVIRRVRKTASLFDANESSLRGSVSVANTTKQSTNQTRIATTPSLRESASADSWQSTINANKYANLNDLNDFWIASANQDSPRNDESLVNDESLALDSLSLNESFFYNNDSLLLADSQSEQRAKRLRNSTQNLNTRNANQSNNPNQSQSTTMNRTAQNDKYYFILTPFVNHNYFFESGRYNLSGLEYGFVTAFSGKLNNSNSLGTHFIFSYNTLSDDANASYEIKSMNINLGLNYKLDLIWDMYVKARIDGFYFLNEIALNEARKIKPNSIGFGASVSYGKDWNFNNYGLLGLSGGLDYKGLYANAIVFGNANDSSISERYSKSLQNLLYIDISVDYSKYFKSSVGLWGLNAKAGIKGNSLFMLKSGNVRVNNRVFDMIVDNDKVLGYANIAGSYMLNTKDFDMEFSLAYYGNYGDRVMSNGGGFEWRVYW